MSGATKTAPRLDCTLVCALSSCAGHGLGTTQTHKTHVFAGPGPPGPGPLGTEARCPEGGFWPTVTA